MDYKKQVAYIRELSKQLNVLTQSERNQKKRQMWADHNELKTGIQPLLWVCPDDDGAWLELVHPNSLLCEEPELRILENQLKKYLYQGEFFHDDFVFEPAVYITIPGEYTGYLYGHKQQSSAWGISILKKEVGKGAYHLENFLKSEEDYEKLLKHEVEFLPDYVEWERLTTKYMEAVDGIIEVQFQLPYSVLVQSHLIELVHLRGLQELMYDVYDEPKLLTRVLKHMADSKARLLMKLEENHLLFDNRINIYTGSGGLGYTNEPLKEANEVKLKDMWGFADAQEFSGVSEEMFEEFAIKNQKIGLNMFGLGCYGCCEPLDRKYDTMFHHITNLRRISVSPWSDVQTAVEHIGTKAIFSWKPNPVMICNGFDEETVYQYLSEVARLTRGCVTEIILKDLRTCGNSNENLVKFITLADRAFERE